MQLLLGVIKLLVVILSSLWLGAFVWTHQPLGKYVSVAFLSLWAILTLAVVVDIVKPSLFSVISQKSLFWDFLGLDFLELSFSAIVLIAIVSFFSMSARNDREWNPEVAQMLDYQLAHDGRTLTIDNVRNFDWQDKSHYQQRWETRQYDLQKLQSLDFVASYWMGDAIAHTLVSFGFSDGQRLALSVEIRKETHEEFSTLGGFFRKFELIIIAADEKDIIYTRSNIRHEDVYIYPMKMDKATIKALLLGYLEQAKSLKTQPTWYNSLVNNCTIAIYVLINNIRPIPFDYRILLSGYIPSYLHEQQWIDNRYSLSEWQQRSHINPKSNPFSANHPISSTDYSQLIRKDF